MKENKQIDELLEKLNFMMHLDDIDFNNINIEAINEAVNHPENLLDYE